MEPLIFTCNLSPVSSSIPAPTIPDSKVSSVVYWNKQLGLHENDRTAVRNGEWLSDKHINAAHSLLREHFPLQKGLQDTLMLKQCAKSIILEVTILY